MDVIWEWDLGTETENMKLLQNMHRDARAAGIFGGVLTPLVPMALW